MSGTANPRKGRPVAFFGLFLLGWIGLRVATFESPWPRPALPLPVERVVQHMSVRLPIVPGQGAGTARPILPLAKPVLAPHERAPVMAGPERSPAPPPETADAPASPFAGERRAAGHNLGWMAAMANLPLAKAVADWIDRRQLAGTATVAANIASPVMPLASAPATSRQAPADRWRFDGWLFLRDGEARALTASGEPNFGASQTGGVLAYRLAPASRHDPAAYVRASQALVRDGESEAALGLRLRPLPALPITAHAELRAMHHGGQTELRPAAFLAGGIEDVPLPLGVAANGYAQAGAVGGRFATAFVDGRLTLEREVMSSRSARLSAGGGVWGGAQQGAARLDAGPTASVGAKLGDVTLRLSADYRVRMAGDAAPASGPAITLSTGF